MDQSEKRLSDERTFTEQEFGRVIERVERARDGYTAEEIAVAARELGAEPRAIQEAIAAVSLARSGQSPARTAPSEIANVRPPSDGPPVTRALARLLGSVSLAALAMSFIAGPFVVPLSPGEPGAELAHALARAAEVFTGPVTRFFGIMGIVTSAMIYLFTEEG